MPSFDRNDRRAKGRPEPPEPPEPCPDICCLSFLGLKHRARREWYAAVPLTSITEHNAGGRVLDLLAKTSRIPAVGRDRSELTFEKGVRPLFGLTDPSKGVVPLFRDAPTQVSSAIKRDLTGPGLPVRDRWAVHRGAVATGENETRPASTQV